MRGSLNKTENTFEQEITVDELKEEVKLCHEFIVTLRDTPVLERGADIVHFLETHNLIKPPNLSTIKQSLIENGIDHDPVLDEDYTVDLDFKYNPKCIDFIADTNLLDFPEYYKLSLRNIG